MYVTALFIRADVLLRHDFIQFILKFFLTNSFNFSLSFLLICSRPSFTLSGVQQNSTHVINSVCATNRHICWQRKTISNRKFVRVLSIRITFLFDPISFSIFNGNWIVYSRQMNSVQSPNLLYIVPVYVFKKMLMCSWQSHRVLKLLYKEARQHGSRLFKEAWQYSFDFL
jgi:hypothetical protein